MANIVFWDFDGVLHPVGACSWNAEKMQMESVGAFRWWPVLEKALLDAPVPVELVVHSTWRLLEYGHEPAH